jgi:hypothetical protein
LFSTLLFVVSFSLLQDANMKGLRRVFSSASCFRPDSDQDHGVVYMESSPKNSTTDKKQSRVNHVEMNHFGESSVPLAPSALDGMTDKVRESLGAMSTLLSAMKAPLPTGTGDGTALPVEKKETIASTLATVIKDVSHLGFDSVEKVAKMTIQTKSGAYIDDKEYLMEHLIDVCHPSEVLEHSLIEHTRLLKDCPTMWSGKSSRKDS